MPLVLRPTVWARQLIGASALEPRLLTYNRPAAPLQRSGTLRFLLCAGCSIPACSACSKPFCRS